MILLQQGLNYGEMAGQTDFFTTLYLPIIIVLGLVVLLFGFLLYKYTFGKWTPENPNPYKGETLGMPRGIFRGVLTVVLLFTAILFEMHNLSMGRDESNIAEFMVAFQMMIAFYFGSKVMHHLSSTDKKKTQVREENRRAAVEAKAASQPVSPAMQGIPDDEEAVG